MLLKNAFITCPYSEDEANRVIESVKNLPTIFDAKIKAEKLEVTLYAETAFPVLVYCTWYAEADYLNGFPDKFIPTSVALGLMLDTPPNF